jgi:molybdate transport system substrate-binding protein
VKSTRIVNGPRSAGASWGNALLVLVIFALFSAAEGCAPTKDPGVREVSVAAAADLRFALPDIIAEFRNAHPDIEVRASYGSSGSFYAQLSNRAPFDVFLSADTGFPRRLVEDGFAPKDSTFSYAIGHLVLWVPPDSSIDVTRLGTDALLHSSVKKIAIANPAHAPYGRAAVAALRKLKLFERLKDKLVRGENVAQAAQYIESGNAQIGIISLSLARAPGYRDGKHWAIPADAYPPLEQGGVMLSWAKDKKAAQAFCEFIRAPEARAILRQHGFGLPKE